MRCNPCLHRNPAEKQHVKRIFKRGVSESKDSHQDSDVIPRCSKNVRNIYVYFTQQCSIFSVLRKMARFFRFGQLQFESIVVSGFLVGIHRWGGGSQGSGIGEKLRKETDPKGVSNPQMLHVVGNIYLHPFPLVHVSPFFTFHIYR